MCKKKWYEMCAEMKKGMTYPLDDQVDVCRDKHTKKDVEDMPS